MTRQSWVPPEVLVGPAAQPDSSKNIVTKRNIIRFSSFACPLKQQSPRTAGFVVYGGEGGIRTLDTLPYTHFPGVRLRPLGHLSVGAEFSTAAPSG